MDLTDSEYANVIARTKGGIVLFHKKLCPHCLNMKKVIEKFTSAKNEAVSVMYIDSESNPSAMEAFSIEKVPALLVVKNGRVVGTKTGLMNPRELGILYQTA